MRLIDADALIENAFEVHTKEFGTVLVVGVDAINEQPTAYDVDAVVVEIQKESLPIFDEDSETNVKVIGTKEVADIVRKGGVNE